MVSQGDGAVMLETREAFLRAIYDAPDDNTPRLVYADWLDEHGDPDRAALIRAQCESDRLPVEGRDWTDELATREGRLTRRVYGPPASVDDLPVRGFLVRDTIEVTAAQLADAVGFRTTAVIDHPEWFGATRLTITAGAITGAVQVETLFTSPATARVTRLDLRGIETAAPVRYSVQDTSGFNLLDTEVRPVITVLGVEALANHRGARRLTELLLTENELDNDAARFLVRSPYLTRLTRLDILGGNRLRGRTWQQVLERFGEDVVGGGPKDDDD